MRPIDGPVFEPLRLHDILNLNCDCGQEAGQAEEREPRRRKRVARGDITASWKVAMANGSTPSVIPAGPLQKFKVHCVLRLKRASRTTLARVLGLEMELT